MTENKKEIGLVLSAGGARAAYQVGVLKYIADEFPSFDPRIFTGISAGSINAAFLSQGEPIRIATQNMFDLWGGLEFKQVLRTNFRSMARLGGRWVSDLFLSKITGKLLLKSMLDASPLAQTLLLHIHFWKISRAIRTGVARGLAISATDYLDGSTVTFFDSTEQVEPWIRERRQALRCYLHLKHIMASCSIPVLFEPVSIGGSLYGDGSLRFNFPFSPAIHLGAGKVISIGIRCPTPKPPPKPQDAQNLSIGFVAGAVLNSIFLDALDFDYENLCRINRIVGEGSARHIPVLFVRPSEDLGRLATNFIEDLPFHLKQLLRATARKDEAGDLLSYLMFSPGYIRALMALGMKDAKAQHQTIAAFLAA